MIVLLIAVVCIAIAFYLIQKSDSNQNPSHLKETLDKTISTENRSKEPVSSSTTEKTIGSQDASTIQEIDTKEKTPIILGKNKFLYPENPMGKLEEGVEYDS